ncbi:MAG: cupredoxin domain-containing protein [Acidimicrobiia bacterium]
MKGFRNRILLPLAVPVGATVFIVVVVFNLSRILLLLEERRSATVATMLAIAAATGVLGVITWLATSRSQSRTAGMSVFACTGLVLVFAGGYSFGAAGEGEGHGEEKAPVAKGGVVNVTGKEFAFDPKEPSVPAGPVTFNLTNTGKVVHTILIDGVPDLAKIVAPKAGAAKGTVDLKPGKYVFFCDEVGHRKAGMEGTLTVTEGGEGGGGGGGGGGGVADLVGKEFAFTPKDVTVPAGPVKINLKNEGKVVHTVLIDGVPDLAKIVAPKAGAATGTVDLKPGKYVFFCDEVGHRKAGMEGTLTVTEGGGSGGGGGGGKGGEANVTGKEFAFDPKDVSVPAGPVKITLKNDGKVVHTILIDGVPDLAKIVAPKAGSASGTVDLKPGKYVFFCDEVGHRKAGMEGTLTAG